jgi:hypothetical protein
MSSARNRGPQPQFARITLRLWKSVDKGLWPQGALTFLNRFGYVIRLGAESPTGVDQAPGHASVTRLRLAAQGPFGASGVEPSQSREPGRGRPGSRLPDPASATNAPEPVEGRPQSPTAVWDTPRGALSVRAPR